MKPRILNPSRLSFPLAAALAALLAASSASAQSNSWAGDAAGNWNDPVRWTGGVTIASGADNTATFGNVITLDRIVTLGADRTIGNITASDTSHNYTISGANVLTLDRTTGVPIIDVTTSGRTLTLSSQISGSDGLQKNGAGTLLLNNTSNNYTGGTILSAGSISFAGNVDSHLGATSGGLTFSGGQINYSDDFVLNRAVTVNANMALNNRIVVNGALSGSSSISQSGSDTATFSNTGNTFTGTINSGYAMTFASLGDSSNPYNFGNSTAAFTWTGGAKTFALRPFTFSAAGNGQIRSSGSGALVIEQNLAISGAVGARTLLLGGSNTSSTNRFGGNIVNGTSGGTSVVSLNKDGGSSRWALSGTNTYTGATTISYNDDNGILVFQGMQALSPSTSLNQNQPGTNQRAGNIRFLDDSATPASRSAVNLNFSNTEGVGTGDLRHWMRAFVGNNGTANLGTSASTQTGSTIQLGNLNLTEGATASTGGGLWLTGANNYRLEIANVNVTLQGATNNNWQATLRADNPMTVTGTVRQANDATAGSNTTLLLEGGAAGSLISGNILNSAGGRLMNVSMAGTGTWTLSGTNAYTGTTAVSAGRLLIHGDSSAATGNVSVTAGSLGGNGGSLGGAVTVSSTGGIDFRDGSTGNFTLGSTLNITGAAGANNLRFDMGNGVASSDSLSVAGTTTVTTTGAAVIDLNWLGGTSGRTPGTYTLIGGAGALDATNFAKFSLATTSALGQTYTLFHDAATDNGNLQVIVANVASATPAAFWAGGGTPTNNWSTTTNWRDTLAGGGAVAGAPDYQTNVTFSTTTPTANQLTTNVLDVDFNINSLTFTNASGNVTIGGTKTLTIEAAAVNGNTLGNGINSLKTGGTNTISAKVGLASSQTWTVATSGTLAVSGAISDFNLGYGLTKAGGGTLTLSGTNSFTGAVAIDAGTLTFSNIASWGGAGKNVTFNGTGTLTSTVDGYSGGQLSVVAGTATISNNSITFASTTGAGSITFNGSNNSNKTLDLGNASGFTGNLRNNIGGTGNVPTKGIHFTRLGDAGSMEFGGGDGNSQQSERYRLYGDAGPLTMSTRQVQFFATTVGGSSFDRALLQNDNTNAANKWVISTNLANTTNRPHSFELGGTNTGDNEFSGAIINSTNGAGFALSLIKQNAGTWFLTNPNNSYTGATTISGGTLVIGGAGRLGSGSYAGNIANAGTFRYSSSANQTLSGIISGAGALTKDTGSSSILTLSTSTNTYTGATNVHAGTLRFAGSSSGTLGAITVGGTSTPVLDIQAGSYTQGAGGFFVGGGAGGAGIVNQTGGTVTWNNNGLQLLIGNGGHAGTYNLSGGSLTTLTGTPSRGVMIGTNSDSTNTFNLSSTGTLTVAGTSRLMIGRSDATQINTTNLFSQSGGTATISDMTMGGTSGGAGSGNSATLSLTGGTFTAAAFSLLSAANNDVSTITIGGTAVVTLPNLPTARGSSATATMNFDGGTLRNSATGTFITGLTNAFIMDDGARFDTSLNSATVSQNLLTHGSSTGGGLTKIGVNTLTLTGSNTYTGNTSINEGTLLLSAGASIANSASITLASSATLDVSTLTTALTLGSGQSLRSSATGANSTATVTTVAGNDLTLSAGGLSFTAYDGTNGNSATNAPLTVAGASAGELKLNGAPVTVTTTSSLAVGTYVLIAKSGSALVTGTPGALTINGSGAAGTGALSVVGDQLLLTISSGGDMTPPTLVSITDSVAGGPVDIGATINYTVTFDEDIDSASVTAADFDNNGTAGITVGTINETSPGVFNVAVTANSAGSLKLRIPSGAVIEDVALNDLVVPVEDDTTITVRTLYATWANVTYSPALTMKLPGDDQDLDGHNNLMEYAFGTHPTVSSSGSIVWDNGGAVTTPGQPVAFNFANPGVDYRAVFGRRKDHVAAGLTYKVEFSAGLDVWVPSAVTPTVLTGAGGLNPSEIEAVSVPYPLLIDVGGNNFKKPTFFRVEITGPSN